MSLQGNRSQLDKAAGRWILLGSMCQPDKSHLLLGWHNRSQLDKPVMKMNLLDNRSLMYMKQGQMMQYRSYQQGIMHRKFQTPPYHQNIYMHH